VEEIDSGRCGQQNELAGGCRSRYFGAPAEREDRHPVDQTAARNAKRRIALGVSVRRWLRESAWSLRSIRPKPVIFTSHSEQE
jgi:hypothetical protein